MRSEMDILLQKLEYLYDQILSYQSEDDAALREFLKDEIDSRRKELLELEVQNYYRSIES